MVQIPDSLRTLFAAEIKQYDDSFVIEVPKQEVSRGDVALGEMYQVALFSEQSQSRPQDDSSTASSESPPVSEGDTKVVTIETTGDQGDGIARIERGYVVIVPGTVPGDELTVEIEFVQENFAMAEIINGDHLTYE
jgi:predicted RNA-binding protein with TRAM domain